MLRSLATAYMIPTAVSAGAAAAPESPPDHDRHRVEVT
jgi:hypothetical protein